MRLMHKPPPVDFVAMVRKLPLVAQVAVALCLSLALILSLFTSRLPPEIGGLLDGIFEDTSQLPWQSTYWIDAQQRFRSRTSDEPARIGFAWSDNQDDSVIMVRKSPDLFLQTIDNRRVFFSTNDSGVLRSILVSWPSRSTQPDLATIPTLGEIIAQLGEPAWVTFGSAREQGTLWLVYHRQYGWLTISVQYNGSLRPTMPIEFVRVSTRLPDGLSTGLPWQGFSKIHHYALPAR
ncbi:MAG: hypothetical protein KF716_07075 [Anaerolineae bacterium]|nr:hypothetical protein [Anaerolineae bacterium]